MTAPGDGAAPSQPSSLPAAAIRPPAGLARRWGAVVYEGLLLTAVLLVAGFAMLPLVNPGLPGPSPTASQLYLLPAGSRAFLLFYYVAVTGVYYLAFWTGGRRTLPMKTWGLALMQANGRDVDLRHAIMRFLGGWLGPAAGLAAYGLWGRWGLVLLLANFGWAWLDPDRQFLHDRIAGTRIVRA